MDHAGSSATDRATSLPIEAATDVIEVAILDNGGEVVKRGTH